MPIFGLLRKSYIESVTVSSSEGVNYGLDYISMKNLPDMILMRRSAIAIQMITFSKFVCVNDTVDYCTLFKKDTTKVNLKSSPKSLNSSLYGSLMSKL